MGGLDQARLGAFSRVSGKMYASGQAGRRTFFEPPFACASQEKGGSNQVDHGQFFVFRALIVFAPPSPASSPCPEGEDKHVMRRLEALKDFIVLASQDS